MACHCKGQRVLFFTQTSLHRLPKLSSDGFVFSMVFTRMLKLDLDWWKSLLCPNWTAFFNSWQEESALVCYVISNVAIQTSLACLLFNHDFTTCLLRPCWRCHFQEQNVTHFLVDLFCLIVCPSLRLFTMSLDNWDQVNPMFWQTAST